MKKHLYVVLSAVLALAATQCKPSMKITILPYPETRRDSVTEDYFGTPVADPYRWLEDDRSTETAAWVTTQNAVTSHYLDQAPFRERVRKRLTELWNYPKYGVPVRAGDYLFFSENDGLQNQAVFYRQQLPDGAKEVFLDPNTMSEEGTVALVDVSFSKDSRYMAYAVAEAGSDWVEIRVMRTGDGTQLDDRVRWVKFSGAEWSGDGFYYSAYDEPDEASMLSAPNRFQKVYYHRLGTPQSADRLIYEDREHPLRYFHAAVSEDDKHVFIIASEGTDGNEVLVREADSARPFEILFKGFDHNYDPVYCKNGFAIFRTNEGAENYHLIERNLSRQLGKYTGKILVAESPGRVLEGASVAGGRLFASYLDKARSVVEQYSLSGEKIRDVALPELVSAYGFGGRDEYPETYFGCMGYTTPGAIYRYDIASGETTLFKEPALPFDPSGFTAEQVWYKSKDGTDVSMFLVYKNGLKRNGKNPAYLYGYGGFNISETPAFTPRDILLMEQGVVIAYPNLRGGGEYGESWHRAGMLEHKQNVFDDFIAAAEYLVAGRWTSAGRLGISGGSNGGLLVGACMARRPDLFAVALPAVGVLDMLRFHKFTVGWGWVVEYGSSETPEGFSYLYDYSPLHNIHAGTCYPATLITTADHDDRVVPAHSFKFAATLQAAQGCDRPTLIRIDTDAGHGAGKPTAKRIDEATDVLSFFFVNTGTQVK